MRVGLIDVDGHNFPNIPLMKLSSYHKSMGDQVEWYNPMFSGHMDKVYMSKVFSFTPDYEYFINADEVIKGGSGYCIETVDGKEIYHREKDIQLPSKIEHIYPDYSLYPELIKDTAYGFMSRGCPRGCAFCHVEAKEGCISYKVADLSEFWRGQKNIVLLDPNATACRDWEDIFCQLIDSNAWVNFSQGLDIRMITDKKIEMMLRMKIKNVHFAWDRYEDKEKIVPKLRMLKEMTGWKRDKVIVYVLTNFDTSEEEDLERIYTLRDLGFSPYVMLYDKEHIPKSHNIRKMQRWVNNRFLFETNRTFEEYLKYKDGR